MIFKSCIIILLRHEVFWGFKIFSTVNRRGFCTETIHRGNVQGKQKRIECWPGAVDAGNFVSVY